jgi:4-amino-4-deoxy-L-arabinose transferase-like glycosyltransferase
MTTNDETRTGGVPPLLAEDFAQILPRQQDRHEWKVRAAVLLFAAAVLIPTAGSFGLWDCWETHYGEVARYMHETGDLLSPWWGYKDQIGTEAKTGEWFFSKPILIMYGDIIFMKLVGFGDWAIRLPWAILGTLGVFFAYCTIGRIFGRRTGLLAAGMLLTSPYWFFLSRQAITDMPFVGTLTIGLLFFMNAYFGPRFEPSNRSFLAWVTAAVGLFLLLAVPQFVVIGLDLEPEGSYERFGAVLGAWISLQKTGWFHAALYFAATAVLLALIAVPMWKEHRAGTLFSPENKDKWMRRAALWTAYCFLGLATLGKGLLGFMLPGAILFVYLLLTSEWKSLKRMEILRGVLMLCLVMLPWYLGMFAKHGNAFYTRFLVHDHFNRLGAGVHQIDTGTFEHFLKWGALGVFPWVGFLPLILRDISRLRLRDASPQSRLRLFLLVWSFFAYLLFTLSATKFHHYIFPAVPPFVLLASLAVNDFLKDRSLSTRLAAIAGAGIVAAVGLWVISDQQAFRNMFTYKYDRPLPEYPPTDPDAPVAAGSKTTWENSTFYKHTSPLTHELLQADALQYETFLTGWLVVAVVIFLLLALPPLVRVWSFAALWASGLVLLVWCLNWYMPMMSPSWSVKYLFEDYFDRCTLVENNDWVKDAYTPILSKIGLGFIPEALGSTSKRVCKEDVIAWLITWRGETYYTHSEIKPLMKANQLGPYLETLYPGGRVFALTQAGRTTGLKSALDRETETLKKKGVGKLMNIKEWKVDKVNEESAYFNLVVATPLSAEEAASKPASAAVEEGSGNEKSDTPPAGM